MDYSQSWYSFDGNSAMLWYNVPILIDSLLDTTCNFQFKFAWASPQVMGYNQYWKIALQHCSSHQNNMCGSRKYSYLPQGWSLEILRGREIWKAKIFKGKYDAKLEIPRGEGGRVWTKKNILGGGMDIFWNHAIWFDCNIIEGSGHNPPKSNFRCLFLGLIVKLFFACGLQFKYKTIFSLFFEIRHEWEQKKPFVIVSLSNKSCD